MSSPFLCHSPRVSAFPCLCPSQQVSAYPSQFPAFLPLSTAIQTYPVPLRIRSGPLRVLSGPHPCFSSLIKSTAHQRTSILFFCGSFQHHSVPLPFSLRLSLASQPVSSPHISSAVHDHDVPFNAIATRNVSMPFPRASPRFHANPLLHDSEPVHAIPLPFTTSLHFSFAVPPPEPIHSIAILFRSVPSLLWSVLYMAFPLHISTRLIDSFACRFRTSQIHSVTIPLRAPTLSSFPLLCAS